MEDLFIPRGRPRDESGAIPEKKRGGLLGGEEGKGT